MPRRRLLVLVAGLFALFAVALPARGEDPVTLLYFGAEGCPYCAQMEIFLDDLEERFGDALVIERHDVSDDPAARDRWVEEMTARGQETRGVPVAILDEEVWVGFDTRIGVRAEAAVTGAIEARASPPGPPNGDSFDEAPNGPPREVSGEDAVVAVPFLGEVDIAARSAIAATALIAFIDGFNPARCGCSPSCSR